MENNARKAIVGRVGRDGNPVNGENFKSSYKEGKKTYSVECRSGFFKSAPIVLLSCDSSEKECSPPIISLSKRSKNSFEVSIQNVAGCHLKRPFCFVALSTGPWRE